MSLDGPLGAYVNPNGWVHETLTFYRATSVRLRGRPTAENSWFPGYAWTIAECGQCGNHLGWRFTSVKRGLNPSKFWGLTRASLRPTLVYEEESDPENKRTPAASPSPWRAVRICYTTSLVAWQSVSLHHPTEVRHSSENVWNGKVKAPSRCSCNAKSFFALDKRDICLKI